MKFHHVHIHLQLSNLILFQVRTKNNLTDFLTKSLLHAGHKFLLDAFKKAVKRNCGHLDGAPEYIAYIVSML